MPAFKYIARDSAGKRTDGSLDAADRQNALRMLQQSGLTPLSLTAVASAASAGKKPKGEPQKKKRFKLERHGKTKMKMRETLYFTREVADLLSSGMTLGRALHTLAKRTGENARTVIVTRLRDEVVQGTSLSDALKIYPETFPPLYISMVRAGEASGTLAEALESLAKHFERVLSARSKVINAMIYPLIVMTIGIGAVILLMTVIVPKFTSIFDELGGTLPTATRIMMTFSDILIKYGIFILAGIVAGVTAFNRWVKTAEGKRWWHGQQLKLPVVKSIARANAFAQFARTLETLIRNGVPILRALSIVQDTVGNVVLADEIASARARVTDGSSISGPLAASQVFPELLTDMLAVGEETGDLPGALQNIARRYDEELDQSIKVLTTVLEPVLILGVAVMVGFVAISLLMAVFNLTSGLGA